MTNMKCFGLAAILCIFKNLKRFFHLLSSLFFVVNAYKDFILESALNWVMEQQT